MSSTSNILLAVGTFAAASAESSALRAQASFEEDQAERNAKLAESQAKEVEAAGEKKAGLHRRKVRQKIGSQRAALAAQGIDVGAGTALDIQADTAFFGELDAQQIRNNAYLQAFGLKEEGRQRRIQGKFDASAKRSAARSTLLAGGLGAVSYGAQAFSDFSKKKVEPKQTKTIYTGQSHKNFGSFTA